MLRSAQAQSEEEQLRDAIEASRNSAAAAAVEADLVRQAIAESMGSGSSLGAGAAGATVEGGPAGGEGAGPAGGNSAASATSESATVESSAATAEGQEHQNEPLGSNTAAAAAAPAGGEEEEELKTALLMSGMAAGGTGAWETLPADVGGPAKGFGSGDLEEDDADLRLAIEASLAGNAN